jgi:aminopeptidase N
LLEVDHKKCVELSYAGAVSRQQVGRIRTMSLVAPRHRILQGFVQIMNLKADIRAHSRLASTSILVLLCLVWTTTGYTQEPSPQQDFGVLHYSARLDPNLSKKTLRGSETIRLVLLKADVRNISFDAGQLVIDDVHQNGRKLSFEKVGKRLNIQPVGPHTANQKIDIQVTYHGTPRFGLEFHPEAGQLYTIFSTSEWLVCLDAPDQRATLDLSVVLPTGFSAIGDGRLVSKSRLSGKRVLYHWRQGDPVPSFVYGFAAGRFNEVDALADGVHLRFLSHDLQPDQLYQLFSDSGDMLKFFGNRAGMPYRGTYSQALVTRTIGQEMAGLALMSEAYGRDVLEKPTDEDLIAHEMAHQWWGIGITCRSWSDFWLNEGFADFMAAAYIQHRFGNEAYQAIVGHWHQSVERLAAAGKDHSLVFEQWDHPSRDDRIVVYQKGAYVLYLLRAKLGEQAFWSGIQGYTHEFWGRSVTTSDFKHAMERSSGQDLDGFFQQWVTGNTSTVVTPKAIAIPDSKNGSKFALAPAL